MAKAKARQKSTGPRGLGRGLSTLMDDASDVVLTAKSSTPISDGVSVVAIDLVKANPGQPRTQFPEPQLAELADSIKASGVLQPLLVRPRKADKGTYQIVAGERRWRAAQRAGLHEIPVVIRDLDDQTAFQIALVENIQRLNLNVVDEARGYKKLAAETKKSQEAIAKWVGKSRAHVANTVRLLRLPNEVLKHLEFGALTAGHARPLIGHPQAAELAKQIIAKKMSVRDAENLAAAASHAGKNKGKKAKASFRDADQVELEQSLSAVLDRKVTIRDKNGKGEIRIQYSSYEDLDSLNEGLSGVKFV